MDRELIGPRRETCDMCRAVLTREFFRQAEPPATQREHLERTEPEPVPSGFPW